MSAKINNYYQTTKRYSAMPFLISLFFVSIIIRSCDLDPIIFSNDLIFYSGAISGSLIIYLWFTCFKDENIFKKIIVEFCLPIFFFSTIISILTNPVIFNIYPLPNWITITVHLTATISGLISLRFNSSIVENKTKYRFDFLLKWYSDFFSRKTAVKNLIIKNKYTIGLIFIFLIGLVVRSIAAYKGNINLDEGIHLYDAKLITQGLTPFRDYFTREPYYIYLLSLGVKIFGSDLLVSRFLSVAFSASSIIVIYFLGKNIFASKKIGLLSAAIASLYPTFIYNNYLGNLYGVYQLVISLCFLWTTYLFKKPNKLNAIILGLMFGAAVHFYRLTIFYFFAVSFIMGIFLSEKRSKKLFTYFYLFSALPYFLPIIYFSITAGYKNFEIIYGTNELLITFFSLPILFFSGVVFYKYKNWFTSKKDILAAGISFLVLALFSVSFNFIGIPKNLKAKVLFDLLLQNWPILLFMVISISVYLEKVLRLDEKLVFYLKIAFLTIAYSMTIYGSMVAQNLQNFGSRIIPDDLKNLFLIFALLTVFVIFFNPKNAKDPKTNAPSSLLYYLILFFAPAIFYLIHVQWTVGNFMSFSVLGSVLAGFGLYAFWTSFSDSLRIVKLSILSINCVMVIIPIVLFLKVPLRDNMYPMSARNEIEKYILDNTKENEEIFTNADLFVVETNRRTVYDLSRLTIYGVNQVYMPDYIGTAKNLVDSQQLADHVKNDVRLLLIDNRSVSIFNDNEYFHEIKNGYYLDKKWPQYEIEAWKKY